MRARSGFSLPATARRIVLCTSLCVLQGCISGDPVGRRKFATQEAAVAQLRAHEQAYRQMAEEWLRDGEHEFCRFGSDYNWNDYRISSTPTGREVMHWDGKEYVTQSGARIRLLFIVFWGSQSYAEPVQIPLWASSTPVRMTLNCEGDPAGPHICH